MARSLSQTLTRLAPLSSATPATRLVIFRHRSNPSEKFSDAGELETVTGKSPEEAEIEKKALKKLEDAIHRIIVKKSEPNWLPLVPGGSYWVPPKRKARGFAEVIEKLASDSKVKNGGKGLSLSYNRGWPSSASYFKGASHSPLEGETTSKLTSQSEDEEV